MLKINRNQAGCPLQALRHRSRDLQNSQPSHNVHVKWRTQRIAQVTDPANFAAAFTQERIVHSANQRSKLWQLLLDFSANCAKELVLSKVLFSIEPVIGRPILLRTIL